VERGQEAERREEEEKEDAAASVKSERKRRKSSMKVGRRKNENYERRYLPLPSLGGFSEYYINNSLEGKRRGRRKPETMSAAHCLRCHYSTHTNTATCLPKSYLPPFLLHPCLCGRRRPSWKSGRRRKNSQ